MKPVNDRGGIEKSWLGRYRLEISPARPDVKTRFLTVLQAADGKVPAMVPVENISSGEFDGVRFTTREGVTATVQFRRDGLVAGKIRLEKDGKVLLDRPLLEPSPVSAPRPEAKPAVPRPANPGDIARIDFTVPGGKVEFADKGSAYRTETPRWLNQGNGALALFPAGKEYANGEVTLKIVKGAKLRIAVKGPDVRKDGKFQPYWIEFEQVTADGKPLLDSPATVWHSKPMTKIIPVKDGDIVKINARFRTSAGPKETK